MWLNLSKNEVLALEELCFGSLNTGQLVETLGKKNSFVSRILNKLEEKGLIIRKGREVSLSPAAHSQSFKKLYDSRPNAKIETWLSGNSMSVLLVLSGANEVADLKLLEEEAGCSRPTLFKVLKSLYAAGIVSKDGKSVRIADQFVGKFVEGYADTLQNILLSKVKGYNVSTRVRKHVILRTDAKEVPAFFSETGISALMKKGLEATPTSYKDYYLNLDRLKRNLGIEEAFIHALLLTTLQQHQDRPVLALFIMRNSDKLNTGRLRALAKKYWINGEVEQVEKELEILRNVMDYYEKGR
jgi:predicted transcriptional regulator